MIKKLRRTFILLSMTAFLLVLVIIIAGINMVNYSQVIKEADFLLEILSENKGAFPLEQTSEKKEKTEKSEKKEKRDAPRMSPEIPYETRYFTVTLDVSGNVTSTETSRIVSVDAASAAEYAKIVQTSSAEKGFLENFRYMKHTENDQILIIFLDLGRKLNAFWKFALVSIIISLLGYCVVFVLIAFFSNRIIHPIILSYEKQKRFITDAGHEIKTPLTIICADADVLELEIGENEWLDDIQKQAKRLTGLTNDLVYLARMEEAEDSMQMIEFPLSDLVSETASSFLAPAQTQNKTFQCDIQPMVSIKGNEKALMQLVTILLDNALKYSPENGTVVVQLDRQNRMIRLSVSNTTIHSISKEHLAMLFERFYRVDSSRNSQTGGHGIGLSVAKAITAAHGGKIQAQMTDESRLQITVLLPG